jgi:hypothetical protein
MCVACGYYACRCDVFYTDIYIDEYYYEDYPAFYTSPAWNPSTVAMAFTSGAIVVNALFVANNERNTPSAFFGFAFGAGSIVLGLSGKAEHSGPTLLLGAASILFAYFNLLGAEPGGSPGDLGVDGTFTPSTQTASGITFSF